MIKGQNDFIKNRIEDDDQDRIGLMLKRSDEAGLINKSLQRLLESSWDYKLVVEGKILCLMPQPPLISIHKICQASPLLLFIDYTSFALFTIHIITSTIINACYMINHHQCIFSCMICSITSQ